MIVLFTDFGLEGPYTGQVKTVLYRAAPGVPVIDLFADLPAEPKQAAYLLAAYGAWFPPGTVLLAVVDPGVGGERAALVSRPKRAGMSARTTVCSSSSSAAPPNPGAGKSWPPEAMSASFHGRDLFAPAAAARPRRFAGRPAVPNRSSAGPIGPTICLRSSISTITATP